ncbi:LuxR C-terminal-related transcriptional regulator [Azospirillum sp. sgz302134]
MFSHRGSLPAPEAFEPRGAGLPREVQDITVLLFDEMPLTRECLSVGITLCDRGLRVLTAATLAEATAILHGGAPPDVALCNLSGLPPGDAAFASRLRGLADVLGRVPLIVFSDRDDAETVLAVFRFGARGHVPTSVGLSVALGALRLVAAGGTFVSTTFLHRMMQEQVVLPEQPDAVRPPLLTVDTGRNGLTPRQRSVMKCLREGKPNKVIAHELGMRESTVKVHVRSILKKLGATNRTQAVYRTLQDAEQ